MNELVIKQNKAYSINDVVSIAKNKAKVIVARQTLELVRKNFRSVQIIPTDSPIYGLNTGVGDLSGEKPAISVDQVQKNILLSHAVGTGELLQKEIVRGIIFSRLIMLAGSMSGVSPELVLFLADLLNNDIVPLVHSLGSIGASDLTILAGTFVVLCNKGQVDYQGKSYTPYDAFNKAGIPFPRNLQTREGLALINGNNCALAVSALLLEKIDICIKEALVIAAVSYEARSGTESVYNPINQTVKPFTGQVHAARRLQEILKGSRQITSDYQNLQNEYLQEPPSFKTITQVIGNALDVTERAKQIVTVELNSITDNPLLVTEKGQIMPFSSGNYLCMQLATVLDQLSLVLAQLAQSCVARCKILVNDRYNEGLPKYLICDNKNNSGFMIPLYTAESVLNEIKALLYPRSILSATVSNGFEDIASNACGAAFNTKRILELGRIILAIECALGVQALGVREKQKKSIRFGKATSELLARCKKVLRQKSLTFPIELDKDLKTYIDFFQNNLELIFSEIKL